MADANVIALVKSVAHVFNLTGKVLEDGKLSVSDLTPVLGFIVSELPAMAEINFKAIPAAVSAMTSEDLAALKEVLVAEFDIPQDKIEGMIEMALGVMVTLYGAYIAWKNAQKA